MKKSKLALLALLLLGFAACGNDGSDDVAQVRFLNASPDAPNVDIYLDGGLLLEDLSYMTASDYLVTTDGEVDITANAAGTNNVLVTELPDFEPDGEYTVLVAGFAAALNGVTYRDDNSLPSVGNIKLRVIHGSPSAGNVDVYVTAPGADITTLDPSIEDLEFEEDSEYLQVPAGDYQVQVTATGGKVPVIDEELALSANQVYTAVALDAAGGGAPFSLKILNDLD